MPETKANGAAPAPAPAPTSASTLIILQISARALTFVLNQLLVRLVSPTIFGLANIQLELLLSTILFLSRDGFRTILIRNDPTAAAPPSADGPRKGIANSIHNIALLPIPIGCALTVAACTVYVGYISPETMHAVGTFRASIALYALGALSEVAYEPLLIRAVRLGSPELRVNAEGVAVFVKVISTMVTIVLLPRWSASALLQDEKATALLAFGIGQAGFGATMLAVHLVFFVRRFGVKDTLDLYVPRSERTSGAWFDRATLSLCVTMSQQGILKHCLTEADKFAVAKYASLEDQGGYALASNYGSLVARIGFQPVEETCRVVFSGELGAIEAEEKDVPPAASPSVVRVGDMLSGLFKLHLLLGCLLTTFGGPLSVAFLYIMAGPRWALETSAPAILAAYTFYLPIMGVNGLVEGFVQSVASQRQVGRYSRVLMGASVGFVGVLVTSHAVGERSLWVREAVGKTGLVWANVVSLMVRAGWCWVFLVRYFGRAGAFDARSVGLRAALPTRATLVVFALVAMVLRVVVPKSMPTRDELLLVSTEGRLQALRLLVPTLALAATCLAVVLGSIILFERKALVGALRSLRGRSGDTRKSQ